jgi:nitrogenase-stabilizing/protective protein
MSELRDTLKSMESTEEFLNFLDIDYDPRVVNVNRLHILQRFHDYIAAEPDLDAKSDDALRAIYQTKLAQAYRDFVTSDALTERVFKVLRDAPAAAAARPHHAFVPLEAVARGPRQAK